MKKSSIMYIAAGILMGSSAILAETGVFVHEKNGNVTFYPSDSVDYIEFVNDNSVEDNPSGPGSGEIPDPSVPVFKLYTAESLELNKTYLMVGGDVCASPVPPANAYGYLPSSKVTYQSDKNEITSDPVNGYTFTSTCKINGTEYNTPQGTFMIKDGNGRYLYNQGTYTSFNLSLEPQLESGKGIADNYLYSATVETGGNWKIRNEYNGRVVCYSRNYNNFAAYTSLSDGDSYPKLYQLQGDWSLDNGKTEPNLESNKIEGYLYPLSYVKLPENTPQQVKEYTGFTVNFNKDNHTPNYVVWELLDVETTGSANRNDYNYWVDNTLEGCLNIDYAYSTTGYERGHMCPAADQKWSGTAMNDCMVMSNMCPQLRQLNAGIWETLEEKERVWAKRDGAIWIVAGPIYYPSDNQYLGKSQARVSSGFFKAFLYNDEKSPRAIAFAFDNGSNPGNLEDYAMSIDDLEKELGYDLFPALIDEVEKKVESSFSFSEWNK